MRPCPNFENTLFRRLKRNLFQNTYGAAEAAPFQNEYKMRHYQLRHLPPQLQ
jgi:hypothetical protein